SPYTSRGFDHLSPATRREAIDRHTRRQDDLVEATAYAVNRITSPSRVGQIARHMPEGGLDWRWLPVSRSFTIDQPRGPMPSPFDPLGVLPAPEMFHRVAAAFKVHLDTRQAENALGRAARSLVGALDRLYVREL